MFNMSHYLKQHQEKGLCERVFDCLLCKKKFNNSFELKLHERLTHESVRPFSCQKCEKTFTTPGELGNHATDHEKTFDCQDCDQTFKKRFQLRRHFKLHHGAKEWAPIVVPKEDDQESHKEEEEEETPQPDLPEEPHERLLKVDKEEEEEEVKGPRWNGRDKRPYYFFCPDLTGKFTILVYVS